ncbi:MAG: VOC family protein [Candidatus Eremiobacteraeota bacterium]|nr:VOC family protein [Candidatus Eremiobacteraeota bacterium]
MANPFVHIELNSQDVGKARAFYAGLFGWELNDMDMGDAGKYTTIGVGEGGTGGGMMQHPMPGAPSVWVPYVLVDDLGAATEKAASLGGTVLRGVTPVANMGSFSIIQDPTGAVFGLWETATPPST